MIMCTSLHGSKKLINIRPRANSLVDVVELVKSKCFNGHGIILLK
jgi:hypothetical protein